MSFGLFSSARALVKVIFLSIIILLNQTVARSTDANIVYTYDKFGRLTGVEYVETQVLYTFGYDKSGNRTLHNVTGPDAQIRLTDTRVLEGGSMVFDVFITRPTVDGVSVGWEVFTPSPAPAYSAVAPGDYTLTSGNVAFPTGAQTATITIPTVQDTLIEFPEEVHVRLVDPTILTIDPGYSEGVGVIRDDDGTYFDVADATVTQEGQFVDLIIQRQGALSGAVDVTVSPTDFEAIVGVDVDPVVYDTSGVALPNNIIAFGASDTTKTVRIQTLNDLMYEADERAYVDFSWAVNGIDGWERADVTIPNDDPIPTLKIANSGNREGLDIVLGAWLTGNSYLPITVVMDVSNTSPTNTEGLDPATPGDDYDLSQASVQGAPAGSLQINGTQLTYTIMPDQNDFFLVLPTEDDTDVEPWEAFYVKLASALLELPDGTVANVPVDTVLFEGRARIRDDDSAVTISIGNAATVQEGTTLSFPVTLSAPAFDLTTATWTITSGSSGDYGSTSSGTVEIQPTETTGTIQIPLIENDLDEANRVISVALSVPVNATLGTSSASGQVNDNDGPPIINIFNNGAPEGNSTNTLPMTVFLQGGTALPVTVTFKTTDGTATAGQDYVAIPDTTVTIQPGSFEHNFDVTILGDTAVESNEYFNVVVVGTPTNATTVTTGINVEEPNKGSNGVGNINNDDNYTYSWNTGSWGGWSTCSGGSQSRTRSVTCKNDQTGATVSDSSCSGSKPATSSSQSCVTYSWSYSSWSGWSACTGQSTQSRSRSKTCYRSDGAVVSGSYCGSSAATSESRSCSYSFSYGTWSNWSTCSSSGSQTQTRSATCVSSTGHTVSNSTCGTPVTSQSQTCTPSYTYSWLYGSWSGWSACTGQTNSTRTRSATCKRSDGSTVSNSYCGTPYNSESQACSYSFSWNTSSWSSWSCLGVGSLEERTRSVSCKRSPDNATVSGSNCSGTAPASSEVRDNPTACGGGGF